MTSGKIAHAEEVNLICLSEVILFSRRLTGTPKTEMASTNHGIDQLDETGTAAIDASTRGSRKKLSFMVSNTDENHR